MHPFQGYIEANSSQTLTIKFLPGVPEKFHKSFLIQVAHFPPDAVNLFGEGVFPRVSLDLPRLCDEDGHYDELLKEAKEALCKDVEKLEKQMPHSSYSTHRESHRESQRESLHDSHRDEDVLLIQVRLQGKPGYEECYSFD